MLGRGGAPNFVHLVNCHRNSIGGAGAGGEGLAGRDAGQPGQRVGEV